MSCSADACPPDVPTPEVEPTLTVPAGHTCFGVSLYYNTQQTYVDSCPLGSPTPSISVVIPPGTYTSSTSQEDADDIALAAAQEQAEAERVLNPCEIPGEASFLTTEDGDFLTTEGGDFITTE